MEMNTNSSLALAQSPHGQTFPTSNTDPNIPSEGNEHANSRSKKSHPLVDLFETEQVYVDRLSGIVRKIASAWSRSNLPPPELDTMFRSIEAIFKVNRGFLAKLKEIGANTTSPDPKALGDLLMTWVDDMNGPYVAYCSKYTSGFDDWQPVMANTRLSAVLKSFTSLNPPFTAASDLSSSSELVWTLDMLFSLPRERVKYYQKLYGKLLRNAMRGGSTDKLLTAAVEKLEDLDAELESKFNSASHPLSRPAEAVGPEEDEIIIGPGHLSLQNSMEALERDSAASSSRSDSHSSELRSSQNIGQTPVARGSVSLTVPQLADLDVRLQKERIIDIFTMKPRPMNLILNQPSLPFIREVRLSMDVIVRFTSNVTGENIVHHHGHIFILTDLFLICERTYTQQRELHKMNESDISLCYPPLVGKHLRAEISASTENAVEVTIMNKERLVVICSSATTRDKLFEEFQSFLNVAATLVAPSKARSLPISNDSRNSDHSIQFQSREISKETDLPTKSKLLSNETRTGSVHQTDIEDSSAAFNRSISVSSSLSSRATTPSSSSITAETTRIRTQQDMPLRNASLPDAPRRSDSSPNNIHQWQAQVPSFSPGQIIVPPPRHMSKSPVNMNDQNHYAEGPHMSQPQTQILNHVLQSRPDIPREAPFSAPYNHSQFTVTPPNNLRKSTSTHSLFSPNPLQAQKMIPGPQLRPSLPSAVGSRALTETSDFDLPPSPIQEKAPSGPVTSTISASMKCKVFLQQQHAQWKSLGAAKLTLYERQPINEKQLVVEADNKEKSIMLSTMILMDGVERVGKTGVAIEVSDKGARTGIVYMIQLRNEKSAGGLYHSLISGSDRANAKI